MKKPLLTALVLVLVVSFTACGSLPEEELTPPSSVSTTTPTAQATKEPSNAAEAPVNAEQQEPISESDEPQETEEISIEEVVLVDEADIKITAKSFDADALFGPEVKLLIENNSSKDLTFQCRNSSVNGYMVDTMMSVDVVSGKKANDALTFMSSDLDACRIDVIADMEFSFHIYTSEDWETYLDTQLFTIHTTAAEGFEYVFDDSGDVAYDENGVKIVIKGLSEDDSIFGPGVIVYIENNSDDNVTVQARDVSINGFMIDPLFSSDIVAKKHAVDAITFMSSDLEDNAITQIESIELAFHIFETESWDTIADSDTLSITF